MRFGVVCEGATDFITAARFLESHFKARNVDVDFVDLQPGLDKTSEANCGWSNALIWLEKNNRKVRNVAILGAGLFSGALAVKKCDGIIFLLDDDCLEDDGFFRFVEKRTSGITRPIDEGDRARYLREVACYFLEIPEAELRDEKHIFSILKHNSESWCIGVLSDAQNRRVETISRDETATILNVALGELMGADAIPPDRRLKNRALREEFCARNARETASLYSRSLFFSRLADDVTAIL